MIVRTDPLGGSSLAQEVIRGADRWTVPAPRTAEDWAARCRDITARHGWREALAPAFGAAPQAAAAERLRQATVVITTGQQPGLFGGPLMTVAKALTALGLADAIERATGTRVAPVFWAATDDADFDEASSIQVAIPGGSRRLRLTRRPDPGTPMAHVPLTGIETQWPAFAEACGSAAWGALRDIVADAYRAERTAGDAYLLVLRAVLEPLGVSVLDASHPAVRAAGSGLLQRAAKRAEAVAMALDARNAELRRSGHEPQVAETPGMSLVFLNEGVTKRRLSIEEAMAAGAEADLSATVLLRPVMERQILPTAAYVGGPAELAYFAQLTSVADVLGVEQPVAVPRWSATVIEPRVTRALDRLGLDSEAVADRAAAEARLAMAHLPPDLAAALDELDRSVDAAIDRLQTAEPAALVNPAVVAGARAAVHHRLERLRRRYLAAVKRHEADRMQDIGTASGSLFPDGRRQERVLSHAQLLIRHGEPLLDALRAAAAVHATTLVESASTAPATPEPA